jgi:hypothetical protein
MQHETDLADFLARQPHIMRLLRAAEGLDIEDCWIGAGLIRNAVWDHLHGFPANPVPGATSTSCTAIRPT